jgi:hypothetical protein
VFGSGPRVSKPAAACVPPTLAQDIGEAETHELEGLYKPLLGGLLEAVLSHADLSSQGIQLEGLDLTQLVRGRGWCTAHSTADSPHGARGPLCRQAE